MNSQKIWYDNISSLLTVKMTAGNSIKLFQFVQKYYRAIGIHPPESNKNDRQMLNSKNWLFILCAAPMLISTTAFLLYQAKTMFDIGLSIYYSTCLIFGVVSYLIIIRQMKMLCDLIENCETFFEKSIMR